MMPSRERRIGLRVAGSLLAGAATALVLVVLAFGGAVEPVITGLALLGFAGGWALLAFTTRRSQQPQPWAWAPATALAVVGISSVVIRPSDGVMRAAGWVWPALRCFGCLDRPQVASGAAQLVSLSRALSGPGAGCSRSGRRLLRAGQRGPRAFAS